VIQLQNMFTPGNNEPTVS